MADVITETTYQKRREYLRKWQTEFRKTPTGIATTMWTNIKERCEKPDRNPKNSSYTGVPFTLVRKEFMAWVVPLLTKWLVNSKERPSIDRIRPELGYVSGNLQIISLSKNVQSRRNCRAFHAPIGRAWCSAHQKYLPIDRFFVNPSRVSGYCNNCKECAKESRLKTGREKDAKVA